MLWHTFAYWAMRTQSQRKRGSNEYGHAGTTRARSEKLPERGLRLEILAVYAGPQAYRAAVPRLDHFFLCHWRALRRSHSAFPYHPATPPTSTRNLPTTL